LKYNNRIILPNEHLIICKYLFCNKRYFVEDENLKFINKRSNKCNIQQHFICVSEDNVSPGSSKPDYCIYKYLYVTF